MNNYKKTYYEMNAVLFKTKIWFFNREIQNRLWSTTRE